MEWERKMPSHFLDMSPLCWRNSGWLLSGLEAFLALSRQIATFSSIIVWDLVCQIGVRAFAFPLLGNFLVDGLGERLVCLRVVVVLHDLWGHVICAVWALADNLGLSACWLSFRPLCWSVWPSPSISAVLHHCWGDRWRQFPPGSFPLGRLHSGTFHTALGTPCSSRGCSPCGNPLAWTAMQQAVVSHSMQSSRRLCQRWVDSAAWWPLHCYPCRTFPIEPSFCTHTHQMFPLRYFAVTFHLFYKDLYFCQVKTLFLWTYRANFSFMVLIVVLWESD